MLSLTLDTLGRLSETYGFSEAFLFGSVTRPGAFTERSDVDVAVTGLRGEDLCRFVAEFSAELERDVHVARTEEIRFIESIRKEGFLWKKSGSQASSPTSTRR